MKKFNAIILISVLAFVAILGPSTGKYITSSIEMAYASEGGGGGGGSSGGGGSTGGSSGGGGGGSHRGHNTQVILVMIDIMFANHYAGLPQPGGSTYTFTTHDIEFLCSVKRAMNKTTVTSAGKDYALTYLSKKMNLAEDVLRAFFRRPNNCA